MLVEWENGESTYEPLHILAADDPITCAQYAKDNGLLDTKGWRQFKRIIERDKVLKRMIHQAKRKKFSKAPVYQYGYQVPRTHNEAVQIDQRNGNTKWQDAEKLELSQHENYGTFSDLGKANIGNKGTVENAPPGHKKIRVHWVSML